MSINEITFAKGASCCSTENTNNCLNSRPIYVSRSLEIHQGNREDLRNMLLKDKKSGQWITNHVIKLRQIIARKWTHFFQSIHQIVDKFLTNEHDTWKNPGPLTIALFQATRAPTQRCFSACFTLLDFFTPGKSKTTPMAWNHWRRTLGHGIVVISEWHMLGPPFRKCWQLSVLQSCNGISRCRLTLARVHNSFSQGSMTLITQANSQFSAWIASLVTLVLLCF